MIQKTENPFSVNVTKQTVGDIKLFVSYAHLFLEKEIDLLTVLDALSVKLTGTSLKSQKNKIPESVPKVEAELKAESKVGLVQKSEKIKKSGNDLINVKKGTLIPVEQITSDSISKQIVKVICCAGIESNNPKVKSLGPNFLAKVLSDEGEMIKVQIIEKNFDPFIFSLPREDVELV